MNCALQRSSKQTQQRTPPLFTRSRDGAGVFPAEGDRLLDDEVLARRGGGHRLAGVKGMGGADVDHVDLRIGEQVLVAGVNPKGQTMALGQDVGIERTARADRRHPDARRPT